MHHAKERTPTSAVATDDPAPIGTVLVVGPSTNSVGGMATVVTQMVRLAEECGLPLAFFSLTESGGVGESIAAKLRRHVRFTGELVRQVRARHATLVHLHTCSGASFLRSIVDGIAARFAGAGVVVHIHGAKFDEFFQNANLVFQRAIRGALERADAVVALSAGWKEKLQEIAPAARVVVIENAVEGPHVTRERALSSTPAEETAPRSIGLPARFVTLTRLDLWKGVDELLLAARILAQHGVNFELTIAGPGGSAYDEPTIRARIASLGLEGRVRYVGVVIGLQKSELLASSDVYVQSSHHEGLPIAVLEAMVHGLAVVATSVGATPEFVEPGRHGLLVQPRNAEALASAMETLAGDPPRREAMGRACRELGRTRFSLERFERDLVDLYGSLSSKPV